LENISDIKVPSCDPSILSYRLSLQRSIIGYPLHSRMTSNQYMNLENDMRAVLSNCSFYPLGTIHQLKGLLKKSPSGEEALRKYFLHIDDNDDDGIKDEQTQFFIASGGSNFWPLGRSTWAAPREGFNSIQIRINQIDHLEIIRNFSPSEPLLAVIQEIISFLNEIEQKLKTLDGNLTYLKTMNIGTGLRITGVMEVPNSVNFKMIRVAEVADSFSLRINGKGGNHLSEADNRIEISNRITFGIGEADILFQFFEGLKNLISLKQSLEVDHVRFSLKT
ncbi:Uncharacterized protein FKW44_016221, partial [Caligus rogercresseyi]